VTRVRIRQVVVAGVVAAALSAAAASPADAFYQRYVTNASFPPGASASSAWNGLTFNSTQWYGLNGTSPYMGTKYGRADGTSTAWLWSNSGNLFDSRTIAYGKAFCAASAVNQYAALVTFCDTGNGG
jgi:hypothetical protein